MDQAEKIVRRFLPAGAAGEDITIATIWLTQQVTPFIRHYDTLSKPPLSLKIDKGFIEQLAADLGRMAVAALSVRSTLSPDITAQDSSLLPVHNSRNMQRSKT